MAEVNGNFNGVTSGGDDDSARIHDWELGLPNISDITPLSHGLIPRGLLSAFNIKPEPYRTAVDVATASEKTIQSLRGGSKAAEAAAAEAVDVVADDCGDCDGDGDVDEMSEAKKPRRNVSPEDADSAAAVKPSRLVWTPQLHKRFVDVVAHLGIKNSVPKTIMQLMNVEGLTRENVASHLQKYRLYLKRNQEFCPVESSGPVQMNPVHVQVPVNYHNQHHHQFHHQQQQNSNNQYNHNNYGVMQTGNNSYNTNNNNQYNYASYHQNHNHHINHNNYPHHVNPGDN